MRSYHPPFPPGCFCSGYLLPVAYSHGVRIHHPHPPDWLIRGWGAVFLVVAARVSEFTALQVHPEAELLGWTCPLQAGRLRPQFPPPFRLMGFMFVFTPSFRDRMPHLDENRETLVV